jgi:hypothetical protein
MVTALFMLMGIIKKPTLWSYFSKNQLLGTPFFPETISLGRLELICRFLHFADNSQKDQFPGVQSS